MSTRIAVVCEDPIYDQYIAKPVIEAAMQRIGKPHAVVKVITNPKTSGWDSLVASIPGALQLWGPASAAVVFVADADCNDGANGRPNRMIQLENAIQRAGSRHCAVGVIAIQELEVWALWGSAGSIGKPWHAVRAECDPKDKFFNGLVPPSHLHLPDRGRKALVEQSLARGWQSLSEACGELQILEAGLRARLP